MSIDPGRLRHRLVVETPVESDDGSGGVVRSYVDAATVWAARTPLGGRADVDADTGGAVATWRILMRAGPALTTRHRLRDGTRRFDIVAVVVRDDGLLDVTAHERTE
jgi:head-tail adaptor